MRDLPERFRLVALDGVDSTNEEARRRAREGAADGTLVWAHRQFAGRGRRGRLWSSPPGNLYCSVLLRPACPPSRAAEIGFVAGLATAEAVAGAVGGGAAVTCKWPNDVLVGGRKLAGILLESAAHGPHGVDWVIVGIGVNVAWFPAELPGAYPATSLAALGAAGASPASLLAAIAGRLDAWLDVWTSDGFGPVRGAWLGKAHGLGRPLTARLESETVEGVFRDLDAGGGLVLETGGGRRRITAGDVFPVETGQPAG